MTARLELVQQEQAAAPLCSMQDLTESANLLLSRPHDSSLVMLGCGKLEGWQELLILVSHCPVKAEYKICRTAMVTKESCEVGELPRAWTTRSAGTREVARVSPARLGDPRHQRPEQSLLTRLTAASLVLVCHPCSLLLEVRDDLGHDVHVLHCGG